MTGYLFSSPLFLLKDDGLVSEAGVSSLKLDLVSETRTSSLRLGFYLWGQDLVSESRIRSRSHLLRLGSHLLRLGSCL